MTTEAARSETTRAVAGVMLSKVPEVTIYFWIIKIFATTIGETAADNLATNLGLGLTGTTWVMAGVLAVADQRPGATAWRLRC